MVRSSIQLLSGIVACWLIASCTFVHAQQQSAYQMLPASTQAVVMIPDGSRMVDNWQRTELARLAKDPAVAPFFDEQRQEIEKRFVDAGWRLNIKPNDIRDHLTGQVAIAWMDVENPRKPFAMSMVADVADDDKQNQELLSQIDEELKQRGAAQSELSHAGVDVMKYTMKATPGQLLAQQTFYAITDGYFFATDDEQLIAELISRVKKQPVDTQTLASEPTFTQSRQHLAKDATSAYNDIEYFARPLGFAKVLRAIGGQRSMSDADMLAVLQNQGFAAIEGVCGYIQFGGEKLDIIHRGFVLARKPLPLSAAILDFPNNASREIPRFIGANISSLLVTNWNANEAFWKAEGLVDEIAGTEGVFEEVIKGIRMDPNGPQVDIRKDVLPHFTNDIYSVSDSPQGEATVNSRRNLIALRVRDAAKLSRVVDRAMENEPDAEEVEFEGHRIWKVVNGGEEELDDDFGDFGSFGEEPGEDELAEDDPWLNEWAITVHDEFLMFASHVEMIEEAIALAKDAEVSPLVLEKDYGRATKAIAATFGEEAACAWNVVRTKQAYRVQYELFRDGKLNESQSMLASILDKLLANETEIRGKSQKVSGKSLPPFEKIAPFLQPSALLVRSLDNGWEFGSVMLTREDKQLGARRAEVGTARMTNIQAEANR
ncbi:MAG: hypothetical protein Aurels2KO_23730 [Aureliella sp.]